MGGAEDYEKFRESVVDRPDVLHVLIADECHSAITKNGAYDYFINDRYDKGHGSQKREGKLLDQENLLVLLVSATPYNVIASKTYLQNREDRITHWFKQGSDEKPTTYIRLEDYLQSSADDARALVMKGVRGDPSFNNFCPKGASSDRRNYRLITDYMFSMAYMKAFRWDELEGCIKSLDQCTPPVNVDDPRVKNWLDFFADFDATPAFHPEHVAEEMIMARSLRLRRLPGLPQDALPVNIGLLKEHKGDDGVPVVLKALKNFACAKLEEEKDFATKKKLDNFSETDRIVLDLLQSSQMQHPPTEMVNDLDPTKQTDKYLKGHMKIIRVGQGGVGPKLGKLFKLARDEFFPMPAGGPLDAPFAVVVDLGKELKKSFQGKDRKFLDAKLLNKQRTGVTVLRGRSRIIYKHLQSLPCILLLCERGRMGDTFPPSFDCLDLRIRVSDNLSTFVQEVGRLCRYALLDTHDEAACDSNHPAPALCPTAL